MADKQTFTKTLAIAGTLFAWIPILITIFFAIAGSIQAGLFRMDYLMPAELFPLALVGSSLLLWASWRVKMLHKPITWASSLMLALLFGSQALAVVSGLASGRTEPAGLWWVMVMSCLGGYVLALLVICVSGILLLCDLFGRSKAQGGVLPDR
jgi:hypothetical protein